MRWHRRAKGGATAARLADAAATRLDALARQWRPVPPPVAAAAPPASTPVDSDNASAWQSVWETSAVDPGRSSERRLRLGPWSGSAVRGLVLLIATALAFAGWWLWTGRPRAVAVAPTVVSVGQPVAGTDEASTAPDAGPGVGSDGPSTPSSTPSDVVVHVAGLVAHPGLVQLPAGSRVAEAIAEAGGVTRPRAADSVNLARVLVDGEQVVVSLMGAPANAPMGTSTGTTATPPLDLNLASAAALEALPGIGPVIAGRIVEWRAANGSFRSVEELAEVVGIGDSVLEQVRSLVRV